MELRPGLDKPRKHTIGNTCDTFGEHHMEGRKSLRVKALALAVRRVAPGQHVNLAADTVKVDGRRVAAPAAECLAARSLAAKTRGARIATVAEPSVTARSRARPLRTTKAWPFFSRASRR